tara:strand:+ start:204 stop:479 length:276 start_codon:yes stop_codon:yes gene_type:complete
MIEYKKIPSNESLRQLHLYSDEKGNEYGSSRFKGQTFDIEIDETHIKRIIFGINEIWNTKHVACISEILKIQKENYIDHMLEVSAWENGYD